MFTFLSDFVLEDHFLHIFNDVTAYWKLEFQGGPFLIPVQIRDPNTYIHNLLT